MQKQFLIFLLNRGLQEERCLHMGCSDLSSILQSLQNVKRCDDKTASKKTRSAGSSTVSVPQPAASLPFYALFLQKNAGGYTGSYGSQC